MLDAYERSGADLEILVTQMPNPKDYGRVLRDAGGKIARIVEEAECSDTMKRISEVNLGAYLADSRLLFDLLGRVRDDNAKGEFYITDVVEIALAMGKKVESARRRRLERVARHQHQARARARRGHDARAHRRRADARGRDAGRSRRHLRGRRRRGRRGHGDRGGRGAARGHAHRHGLPDRPRRRDRGLDARQRRVDQARLLARGRAASPTAARSVRTRTCAPAATCARTCASGTTSR